MRNKKITLYICICLMLCMIVLMNDHADKHTLIIDEASLSYSQNDENAPYIDVPRCNLPAGKYNLAIQYTTSSDSVYFQLHSKRMYRVLGCGYM